MNFRSTTARALCMSDASELALSQAIDHMRHLVPGQSPLDRFVHHNPLHSFEHLPFEEAVIEAAALYENEPFWSEEQYHAELKRGRIQHHDLRWVVDREIADGLVAGVVGRRRLVHALLAHPFQRLGGEALAWTLSETDVLQVPRTDLRPKDYDALVAEAGGDAGRALERLWRTCEDRRPCLARRPVDDRASPALRVRDLLVQRGHADLDKYVQPLLIRWCGAFLDHGVSHWQMNGRQAGFYQSFLLHFDQPIDVGRPWLKTLRTVVRDARRSHRTPTQISLQMLDLLGHPAQDFGAVIRRSILALPGWAGMFQRLTDRPDTAPEHLNLPTEMAEFVAVRLMLEVSAATWMLRGRPGATLMDKAQGLTQPADSATPPDPAWTLFQVAQMLGLGAHALGELSDAQLHELLAETYRHDDVQRRRLLHMAYERRFRVQTLDAIVAHVRRPVPVAGPAKVQCVFCVDDREESTRRLLEEVAPWIQTLGGPGSYGISMYYDAVGHGHAQALGPAGFEPKHVVVERSVERTAARSAFRGMLLHHIDTGSQTLLRGGLVSLGGVGAAIPMALRILAPKLHARLTHGPAPGPTSLQVERSGDERDEHGHLRGFSLSEMLDIAEETLRMMSLVREFSPLVCFFGHGSRSMNNPHEAAHDCGACGGGRGGPNARLFARFLNDPRVREGLGERGVEIGPTTWFVGAYHNTADDVVDWYDLDRVPDTHRELLDDTRGAVREMRALDAHERCRKFENVPLNLTPAQALESVENRVEDLAQPRPEYGHCTNAICLVGRRSWSRGLFLDRRSFLCSYDPSTDPDGAVLASLLTWALPVGAGINLEYWFSVIDNEGYGSGTKLPHNITGLIGVMNGHQSDLRTGLPWQMVEVHEPVRLLCVVEASAAALLQVASDFPAVGRLVTNRWIQLASLNPDDGSLLFFEDGEFKPWTSERSTIPTVRTSRDWYGGTRGLLPPATVRPEAS